VRVRYVEGIDAGAADDALGLTPVDVSNDPSLNCTSSRVSPGLVDPQADPAVAAASEEVQPDRESPADLAATTEAFVRGLGSEIARLVGPQAPDIQTLERAARIVASEQSWRRSLGVLLDEDDVARLLNVDRRRVGELVDGDELIVLTKRDGAHQFPAYQFQGGATTAILARVHRTLVDRGHLSPWSAASWVRSSPPDLESRSPAQWAAEGREEDRLLLVAERDAARLAQ
jgi:hypothetical protein